MAKLSFLPHWELLTSPSNNKCSECLCKSRALKLKSYWFHGNSASVGGN